MNRISQDRSTLPALNRRNVFICKRDSYHWKYSTLYHSVECVVSPVTPIIYSKFEFQTHKLSRWFLWYKFVLMWSPHDRHVIIFQDNCITFSGSAIEYCHYLNFIWSFADIYSLSRYYTWFHSSYVNTIEVTQIPYKRISCCKFVIAPQELK